MQTKLKLQRKTYVLKDPLEFEDGTTIDRLELRRPMFGDSYNLLEGQDGPGRIELLSKCSDQPQKFIEMLSYRDANGAYEVIADFLASGQQTGNS